MICEIKVQAAKANGIVNVIEEKKLGYEKIP
jgi:hypothetical protein